MNVTTLGDIDSERQFEQRLAQLQRQRAERFSPKARMLLALVPAWTDALASVCSFPYGSFSPDDFVREAAKANICVFERTPSEDGESSVLRFWAPAEARTWLLRDLSENENIRSQLLEEAVFLGQTIERVALMNTVLVSPLVLCWAKLAASLRSNPAQELIETITELVSKGETGEAQTWVAAAKLLAQTFGGPLESAVRVGENLIEREYRRVQDEGYLERFKPIGEQIDAFRRLMPTAQAVADAQKADPDAQSDVPWALHYVGSGGVGKTMLLRYITGRLLVENKEPPQPFSRIDFDYLSPDYPMRRPGQLLQELAAGLRAQITSRQQDSAYATFQNLALELHEALSEEPTPDEPLANIRRHEFEQTLKAFNEFLLTLPQPVVLFLDTCEELAKMQTAGGRMPTVEATFEILERVRAKVPLARVVFAGRRLLAKAGHDWNVCPGELADARKFLPERKSYLLLHDMRGFDKEEAQDYLAENEKLQLAESLRQAVLGKSIARGRAARIHFKPPRPGAATDSYNPFDLSLYAQWIREDPKVEAKKISAGKVDPYVEIRIVNRVAERVREVLPAVVLLRRFDKEMLAEALASPERLDEVYQQLSAQEWINYQWDEELQTNFLEVDRNLHGRLLDYYECAKDSSLLDRVKEKIAPGLAQLVRKLPTRRLTVEHLDAVLRLLPATEAAEVWGDYELRVAEDGTWTRALRVTERILSEEGAVKNKTHPLRAAVLATRAAATLHVMPELSLQQYWTEVAETAPAHPDPEVSKWLTRRAMAGNLASRNSVDMLNAIEGMLLAKSAGHIISDLLTMWNEVTEELRMGVPEGAPRKRMEQLVASFCAVHEAYIEGADLLRTDERGYPSVSTAGEAFVSLHPYFMELEKVLDAFPLNMQGGELIPFAASLQGRSHALEQNWDEAGTRLHDATEMLVDSDESSSNRQRWLDWRAPASLRDRLRLERLRCIPAGWGTWPSPETLGEWQSEAATRLGNIDSERLVSLIIQKRLTSRLVPVEKLQDLLSREKYDPNRQPWRAAHRAAPPLLCSLALGWLAQGDGARGLDLVNTRIDEATGTRADQATVRAAEAVKLHIIRRLRLPRRGTDLINRLARSTDRRDVLAVRELIAVSGSFNPDAVLQPTEDSPISDIHAWWRSQVTLTREAAGDAVERLNKLAGRRLRESVKPPGVAARALSASSDTDLLHLTLDWEEAEQIAQHFGIGGLLPSLDLHFYAWDWWELHPTRTEDALRLMLRCHGLGVSYHGSYRNPIDILAEKVGKRLCAEIMLEEGELLALRLPDKATWLFYDATQLFQHSADKAGATIAGTRNLIAYFHAMGKGRNLHKIMVHHTGGVPFDYSDLAYTDSTLPGLTALNDIYDKPTAENLARLNHPSWQGWLHRLVTVVALHRSLTDGEGSGNPRERVERAEGWSKVLEGIYGQRLPVELILSPDDLERRGSAGSAAPLFLRILFRYWLKALGFPALFFALLIGGVVIMLKLGIDSMRDQPIILYSYALMMVLSLIAYLRWMKKGLTPLQTITYLGFASLLFTVGLMIALFFLFIAPEDWQKLLLISLLVAGVVALILWAGARKFRELNEAVRAALSDASLQIRPDADEGALKSEMFDSRSVRMIFRRSHFTGKWLPGRKEDIQEGTGEVEGIVAYREAMKMMPLEVSNELFRLNGILRKARFAHSKLRVALEVAPSLAHYPWEAALSEAAAGEGQALSGIQFWRVGEPLAKPSSIKYEKKVFVVVSRTWEMLATNGWSRFTGATVRVGDFWSQFDPMETLRVLHLIGTPVKLSAGLRLKISAPATSDPTERVGRTGGSTAAAGEGATYIGTENLPLDRVALVVLQGEPSEFSERQQTQREQMARLRAYAADIFAAGAPRVVLLPALPDALAEEVLQQLGKDLRAGDQPILLFLETIERMQNIILKNYNQKRFPVGDPVAETHLELALDICVFTRDASPLSRTSKDK